MNQVITFSADLTADSASRTVSGKIVPLNVEAGSTNMGKVIFASGSIAIRIALIKITNLPKPDFLAIDEGLGVLDSSNLNSMHTLFTNIFNNLIFI